MNELGYTEHGTRVDPPHIVHCFDYLRQSLMCAADTNLEVLDKNRKTNGWGREKKCRDYWSVVEFAERYADSVDQGINDDPRNHIHGTR